MDFNQQPQHQQQQPSELSGSVPEKPDYTNTTAPVTGVPPAYPGQAHVSGAGGEPYGINQPQTSRYDDGYRATHPAPGYQASGPKFGVAVIYKRLAVSMCVRWVCAMVALALAAVILSQGPAKMIKIAAAYTIAVSALHLPFPGFPMMRPRAPDNARAPRWFGPYLTLTSILWIPTIALMIKCCLDGYNYASDYDYDDSDSDSGDDDLWFWKRRFRTIPLYYDDYYAEPISKLGLGCAVLAVFAILCSLVIWAWSASLGRGVYDPETISELYYRNKKPNQVNQQQQEVQQVPV